MAILCLRALPAAAIGWILCTACLGAQSLAESSSTFVDHSNLKPQTRADLSWKLSVAALATANILDVSSSWGKCEQNGVLAGPDGKFSAQGTLVKAGIVGSVIAVEWLVTRKINRPKKAFSILNFGSAAGIGALALRNYGIAAPPANGLCR